MLDKNYEQVFEKFKEFFDKENERKQRENDYNPLLVIRSASDEVRLHSRMLHSLLDPQGKHYQKALFLEPFLEILNLQGFDIDASRARVFIEYKHIDLYISDGERHIIIENKVYTGDGEKQIERYIEQLLNEHIGCENIAVAYLSVDENDPSPNSLGEWKKKGEMLAKDGKQIRYKNITYKDGIIKWIENCQEKVKNITNLYASFEFYKKCVEQITKGKKMNLEEFLLENDEFIAVAAEIQRANLEEISIKAFKQKVLENGDFSSWKVFCEKDIKGFETGGYTRTFAFGNERHLNQCFKFMLTLEKTRFNNKYIGFSLFVKKESYNHFCGFKDKNLPKKLKLIIEKKLNCKLTDFGWWLLDDDGNYAVDLTQKSLYDYFNELYKKVNELNDFLGEQERQSDSEIAKLADEVKLQ